MIYHGVEGTLALNKCHASSPGSLKPECLGAEDAIQDELRVSVFFLAAELKKFRGGSSTDPRRIFFFKRLSWGSA